MKAERIKDIIEEVKFLSGKRSQNYVAAKAQVSTAMRAHAMTREMIAIPPYSEKLP